MSPVEPEGEHPYDRLLRRRAEIKQRQERYKWVGTLVAWLMLVAGVIVVAWFVVTTWVDVRPVRCTVVSAVPDSSSGGSRGGASIAGVLVETQECGPIQVTWGVTSSTEEEVAESFRAGAVWDFDMTWGAREVNRHWLRIIPAAKNQRLIEQAPPPPYSRPD